MLCAGDAHFHIAINAAGQYVFHEQSMDIFDGVFIQRLSLGNTLFDKLKGFAVVDNFINLAQRFTADRNTILQNCFGLNQRQRITLYRGRVMGILHFKAFIKTLQRLFWKMFSYIGKLFFFLTKHDIIQVCSPLFLAVFLQ